MKFLKKAVAIELLLDEAKERGINPYFLAYMNFKNYKTIEQVKKYDGDNNYHFMSWNNDAWEITRKRAGKLATQQDHLETLIQLIDSSPVENCEECGDSLSIEEFNNKVCLKCL